MDRKTYHQKYFKENRSKINAIRNRYDRGLRLAAITAYSPDKICACCGESEFDFLAIDHIEGGGNEHRKSIGSIKLYQWLKNNSYPEGFQVLCHNCNYAKHLRGTCPHKVIPINGLQCQ